MQVVHHNDLQSTEDCREHEVGSSSAQQIGTSVQLTGELIEGQPQALGPERRLACGGYQMYEIAAIEALVAELKNQSRQASEAVAIAEVRQSTNVRDSIP